MSAPAIPDASVITSWWYGKGRAEAIVRQLEGLNELNPAPSAAGIVTVQQDLVRVEFVDALKGALPLPWQIDGHQHASTNWDSVPLDRSPAPTPTVFMVALGIDTDGGLVALNLAALPRLQFTGDKTGAAALAQRWVLELRSTHPGTRIAITADLWPGPYTSHVLPVTVTQVPDAEITIVGGGLSYADRAQIFTTSRSRILLDLGDDAANKATWTINCGDDGIAELGNGRNSRQVTMIASNPDVLERCRDLLVTVPGASAAGMPTALPSEAGMTVDDDEQPQPAEEPAEDTDDQDWSDTDNEDPAPIHATAPDFFASPDHTPAPTQAIDPWASVESEPAPPPVSPQTSDTAHEPHPPAATGDESPTDPAAPQITEETGVAAVVEVNEPPSAEEQPQPTERSTIHLPQIWNRILGQIELCPPAGGPVDKERDRRLIELTTLLQVYRTVSTDDIIRHVLGGAAQDKTVHTQMSWLRTRLGTTPAGKDAVPKMSEGLYHLDQTVRSDWMVFDDLLEMNVAITPVERLAVAMDLVTGPPMHGLRKPWAWSANLRDLIVDRVADAADVLSRHYLDTAEHSDALATARKGLLYNTSRQDLWRTAATAAKELRANDVIRELRNQYQLIPAADRDATVADLIGRG